MPHEPIAPECLGEHLTYVGAQPVVETVISGLCDYKKRDGKSDRN